VLFQIVNFTLLIANMGSGMARNSPQDAFFTAWGAAMRYQNPSSASSNQNIAFPATTSWPLGSLRCSVPVC